MAIALINSVSAGAVADGNSVTTAADNMTGADFLIMASSFEQVSGTSIPTESDSQSNAYTDLGYSQIGPSGVVLHYKASPSVGASQTFTTTVDGAFLIDPSVCAAGFSGLHPTPFDVEAGDQGNNAQSTIAVSLTPTVNGCLIVSSISIDRAVTGMGITTTSGTTGAWTIIETVAFSSGNCKAQWLAYCVQTAAGAFTASWDWTENAQRSVRIASFKPAIQAITKTIGSSGVFSTLQLWNDGSPANLTTSNRWSSGTHTGTFVQGEVVTGTGIVGGKMLDTNQSSYIAFGTTSTPAAGITVTGSTSGATCVLSGTADVGVIWEGHCQNQEFTGTTSMLRIINSTSSATCYKHLTTAPGASFRDHASVQTNPLRYDASTGAAITSSVGFDYIIEMAEANCRISKLQIKATGSGTRALFQNGSGGNKIYEHLILEGTTTGTGTNDGVFNIGLDTSHICRNVVAIQRASAANHIVGIGTQAVTFVNCTFVAADDLATAPTYAFRAAGATHTVKNCAIFRGSTSSGALHSGGAYTYTTCMTDMTTPPSGCSQVTFSSQFENVNNAASDYRLKTAADCIDAGTTDATNAPKDIVGTARPQGAAYDVGAWEFIGGVIPVLTRQYRQRWS